MKLPLKHQSSVRTAISTMMLLIIILCYGGNESIAGQFSLCNSVQDCIDDEIDYLMIVAAVLEDDEDTTVIFNPLVDSLAEHWADFLDLNVGIVSTENIVPLVYTTIHDFIQNVYESSSAAHMNDGHLGFVLLIGDWRDDDYSASMIPTIVYLDEAEEYHSDHFYACVTYESSPDSCDDFPDLLIGRLSVGTAQDSSSGDFIELSSVVEKTVRYNTTSRDGWGDDILLVSSDSADAVAFGKYLDTLTTIIPSNYDIDEIRGWESPWNLNASMIRQAIISRINEGRWIIDGLAHGTPLHWKNRSGDQGAGILRVTDLDDLTNRDMYPVIFALSCQTGSFTGQTDCMAEEYVNADSRGAITYLGADQLSSRPESEMLLKSIHRALFNDHAYFMGEMIAAGKTEFLSKSNPYYNEAHNYNLFGDPAVNIMWDASDTLNRPDLVIAQSQITQISPWPASVGDTMTIQAVVENKGLATADTAFTVHFYNGHPDSGGVLIDEPQTIDSLQAWHSDTVQVDWPLDTLLLGYNKIYVLLDSADAITEIYEDNNLNWNWLGCYLYQEGFPDTVSKVQRSNPVLADVVGDSDSDVLIAGNCWSGDTLAWSFSKYPKLSSPAVGDIDNDGHQEIVISIYPLDPDPERSFDSLFVYQKDSLEYSWGSDYSNVAIFGTPSLAHLDADNTLDIVFALSSNDHDSNRVIALHVADDSLQTLWLKTVNGQDYYGAIQSSPAIGDIDSDGKPEIVVLSDSGYIYALNGEDGSFAWVKQIGGGYSRGSSKTAPVLADVDEDGKLEIIARTNEDYLAVLKGENGEDDTVSRYFLGDDLVDETLSPCVGDVDGDGQLEILFQTESALLILSSSLSLEESIQIPESTLGVISPALADLNSDNEQEILVAAGNTLFAFESDGDTLFEVPLIAQWAVAPAVGDIDGDGDAEIIGAYQSGLEGIVHVCDYWGQLGDIEWGMFHHDPRRTGCYAQPEPGDTLKDDKVWSGNVVVYGDIIIDSSVTLTIEPGTTVEFDTTDAQSSGEDENKCELIVNGTLKAEGTESDNIIFTSHALSPAKGDWYGIVFTDDTSDSNQISYCQIEYANKGISCSECSVDVFHSQMTQCFYGCYVCSSGTKLRLSHATCDSCSYGAYIQTGKARLDTCSFVRNDVGVKCDATAHYFPQGSRKADWKGCTISNNVYGAIIDDASPIINYCHIDSNSQWGLQCLDDSDPVIGETRFIGHGDTSKDLGHSKSGPPQYPPGGGLFCTGTSTPIVYEGILPGGSDYMRGRNVFTHLNGYAIYCGGQSNPKLGFKFFTSQGKNSIHDNSPYDVFNETGTTVKAEKNFWTAVADSSVPDSIYGSVDWVPTWKDSAGSKASWYTTRDGLFEKQSRSPARHCGGSQNKGGEHDSSGVAQEYNDQGTYYLMQLQYDNAISAFQYVLDHYADCHEANYALVHLIYCYKEAGYWSNINSYLENIAVSCSNPYLENLALYLSISQLVREEQYQSALSMCQALLLSECDEDMERSLRLRLGTMYRYGLNNDQAAISAFRDFLFRYPVGPLSSIARIELEILGVSVPPGSVPEEPTAKPVVALPETYALHQNYPNPFNAYTSIRYALPEDSRVSLKIFNILGQRVVTLVNELQPAGNYIVSWDGTNSLGSEVSSGIYFIRMEVGDFSRTRKLVLLR